MKRMLTLSILVLACVWMVAQAAEVVDEPARLPDLDGSSAEGLVLECQPTKPRFTEGKSAVIKCTVTNTTDSLKPFGWDVGQSVHYEFVQSDATGSESLRPIPTAQLRLEKPIMIQSKEWPMNTMNRFILYIPPKESITLHISYTEGNLGLNRGRIMYDPIGMRNILLSKEMLDQERVYSNEFEYEVVPDMDHL